MDCHKVQFIEWILHVEKRKYIYQWLSLKSAQFIGFSIVLTLQMFPTETFSGSLSVSLENLFIKVNLLCFDLGVCQLHCMTDLVIVWTRQIQTNIFYCYIHSFVKKNNELDL